MDAFESILASVATAVLLAALAILALRRSFLHVLVQLCGDESRGRFWRAFSGLAILLTTIFGALATVPAGDPSLWDGAPHLGLALSSLRAGVFGLILALAAVALVLLVSIGQREPDRERRAAG